MPDPDRSVHRTECMSVSVVPQTFNFVAYDAALIERVAEELLASLGLDPQMTF